MILWDDSAVTSVAIIGGGPGGYEAALVAAQLGGQVTLVEETGLGGAAVLTDCVPSKTLIATAEVMSTMRSARELGLTLVGDEDVRARVVVDLARVNRRVLQLASAQSADIHAKLLAAGVEVLAGRGRLLSSDRVQVTLSDGSSRELEPDVVLLAVGTHPRVLPDAQPDGERILTWKQVYNLTELPTRLIVVGSGVTGAEFASAYHALGVETVLVSSRDQVLPGHDPDAARVLQDAFESQGMQVVSRARALAARREGDEVVVTLADGQEIRGSHCLFAVGSIPSTGDLGLAESGVEIDERGYIVVDKVSRTTQRNIYAAGDCTGVFALASVAAMQGRIAMWHALGDAVAPLDLSLVSSNVFTAPEIATVGVTQADVDAGRVPAVVEMLPLAGNARAKMLGIHEGFVKLFCRPATGNIIGGVVVAPKASELIHPIALAVAERITVDQFSQDFTVYPSLSGSLAEAARQLHGHNLG